MKRMIAFLTALCLLCPIALQSNADAAGIPENAVLAAEADPEASTAPEETEPTPEYPSFTDVPEELEAAVAYVIEHQLMEETSPFTFSPELVLSRANAVSVLYNLAGRPEAAEPSFPDVKGDWWYTAPIGWASSAKLISGYGDGRFGPKDPLTREQLACILYGYQKTTGRALREADLSGYADADAVSGFARSAVAWAVGSGVLQTKNSAIRPKDYATRGDMAQAVLALAWGISGLPPQESITYTYARLYGELNLRAGPGKEYEVLAKCNQYWHLFVLQELDKWLLVRCPSGQVGYVSKGSVTCEEETLAIPTISEAAVPISEEEAAARIQQLKELYPDGMYWNNQDESIVFDSAINNMDTLVSDKPCSNFPEDKYCNKHMGISTVPFSHPDASQCMGYASMLSDTVFGAGAPVRVHKNLAKVRVGDLIRLVYESHSVMVTEILEEGFRVTECNRDFETCRINWGRVLTWEYLTSQQALVVTRYPEPESDGSSQILYAPGEVPVYAAPGDETAVASLWLGEFVYVICRQADNWYLVARESGEKVYVQADQLVNLYRAT